jgi:hypothetical protein
MNKQPSLVKIATIDYFAFVGWLSPVVSWMTYFALLILGKAEAVNFSLLAIFAAGTLVALAVFAWRIQVFNTVFNDGLEATATISNVSFFRDRGRVEYIYTHQGQKYLGGNALHKVKQTQALQVGQQVVVMVDRNNPKRAFIRDLYV